MKKHPPPISIKRSRDLRRNPTDAERVMWHLLRTNFPDARFRRQVPLRQYIVDFASHQTRLVIEVDGGQHSEEGDAARTAAISVEGYRIVRFWNNDVIANAKGCASRLAAILTEQHPYPTATRQRAAKSSYPSPIKGEAK